MAIVNLNGVIAGLQPVQWGTRFVGVQPASRPFDSWYAAGGQADTTLNGVVLSSSSTLVAGQIQHFDPPGGTLAYLARLEVAIGQGGSFWLCDRLWHQGGLTITSTSAQTLTSPTWPARDINGATAGDGVYIGLSVSAATTGGPPTAVVISYTNTAGTSGRTGNLIEGTAAAAIIGTFYRFGLQGNDTGVQSVQSVTFTNPWATGTVNLVAYRPLAAVEAPVQNMASAIDAVNGGFPQLYNGVVPFPLMLIPSLTSGNFIFAYQETQG